MELENVPKVGSETARLAPAHHPLPSNPLPAEPLPFKGIPLKARQPDAPRALRAADRSTAGTWHGRLRLKEKLPALLCSLTRAMASGARETHCGDSNSISGKSDSEICKELLKNDQSVSDLQGEELRAETTHLL